MSIDSLGIHLGPLYIRFYGVIIVTGAIAGGYLASYEAKRLKLNPLFVWDLLTWLLIGGIIGARLYHVVTPSPSMMPAGAPNPYFTDPVKIIQLWRGGLGIPGGLLGGALTLWIYTKIKKESFPIWADILMPAVLLGQAIGRWGNFVNQELYGLPTDLPWRIYIAPQNRTAEYVEHSYFHPLFLYESILNLLGCIFLLWINRKHNSKLIPGDITLGYFVVYPSIRFLLEFIRVDSSRIATLNANQTLMAIVALASVVALIYRKQMSKQNTS